MRSQLGGVTEGYPQGGERGVDVAAVVGNNNNYGGEVWPSDNMLRMMQAIGMMAKESEFPTNTERTTAAYHGERAGGVVEMQVARREVTQTHQLEVVSDGRRNNAYRECVHALEQANSLLGEMTADLSAERAQCRALRETNAALMQERDSAVARTQQRENETEKRLKGVEEELRRKAAECEQERSQKREAIEMARMFKEERDHALAGRALAESEKERLKDALSGVQTELTRANQAAEEGRRGREEANEAMQGIAQERDRALAAKWKAESERKSMEGSLDWVLADLGASKAECERVKGQLEGTQERVTVESAAMKTQLAGLESKMTTLGEQLEEEKDKNCALQVDLKDAQRQLERAREEKDKGGVVESELTDTQQRLQREVETAQKELRREREANVAVEQAQRAAAKEMARAREVCVRVCVSAGGVCVCVCAGAGRGGFSLGGWTRVCKVNMNAHAAHTHKHT